MKLISPKRLEPFAWMLETFVKDEFISAEEKVKSAIRSHHGYEADRYWEALQLYIKDRIHYEKQFHKQ